MSYYSVGLAIVVSVARWIHETPKGGLFTVVRVMKKPLILYTFSAPAFAFTEGVMANLRQKEAKGNSAAAGFVGALFIAQAARTKYQAAVIPFIFAGAAWLNEAMPWTQHHPYDVNRVIARDNDRLMAGEQFRRWEDIKPPPGEGYGIWPGADRSYTIGVKVQGATIGDDFWLPDTSFGQIYPKGGVGVLRPENKEGRMPHPVVYKS